MNNPAPIVHKSALLRHPLGWLGTGFGSGLSPFAPGTAGSAAALLPAWWLIELHWLPYSIVLALTFALGCWAGGWINRRLGSHDAGCIVIDEFFGQWLTLLPLLWLAPQGWARLGWLLAGFLLFRIADIFKPWPASWADREVHGGLGVMLDDAFAALWSLAAMLVLIGVVTG